MRIKESRKNDDGTFTEVVNRYETTVGRALLSEILPAGLSFALINKPLKKKEISKLINEAFRRCGIRETVIFADKLMYTGFTLRHPRGPVDLRRRPADPGRRRPASSTRASAR